TNEISAHNNYLMMMLRARMAVAPYRIGNALNYYIEQNEAKRAEVLPKLQEDINNTYQGMYLPLEKDLLAAQLNLYSSKAKNIAPLVAEKAKNINGIEGWKKYVDEIVSNSIFQSKDKVEAFLENPDAEKLQNDPL